MIVDRIENFADYPYGDAWNKAFEFLKTLTPETETRRYELLGDDLYVMVDSYETKARSAAKLETHAKYIDIQFMIDKEEVHEIHSALTLSAQTPYDPEKDVSFFYLPEFSSSLITLRTGEFAVYFPQDAHMPCLMSGDTPQRIKKAVVKIKTELMHTGFRLKH
ncbi:MAG: YhcH/YjgK/YiaL family protein [Kiritimatiellales bacterium]